ncbi:DNA helicase [Tanacetum coccineum]
MLAKAGSQEEPYIGNNIEFVMWNEIALNFDIKFYEALPEPILIVVSSCRVLTYRGFQLAATQATHYYLNPAIPEIKDAIVE